ncbi:helix-turn-helix domain-containing protein [Mycolicibacterium fortuitum]|uniref:helix-turn-helix domain-containing protein n=1 Tax=Mycolicibacterium fortuitum TaxID=1766 RepID=UPI003AAA8CAF
MNVFEWSKLYFRSADRSLHETKATMAALMTYADFDALTCYPSQKTLSEDTGTSVDTVSRHIRKNVEAGWLRKIKQGNSYKRATEYQLCVPTPRTDAGSPSASSSQLPAGMQGVPPAAVQSTPRTDAGSTPRRDAVLTTHTTTHGTTHTGGSLENHFDPWEGSSGVDPSPIATNEIPTPRTAAGSSPGTAARRQGPALPSIRPMSQYEQAMAALDADLPRTASTEQTTPSQFDPWGDWHAPETA